MTHNTLPTRRKRFMAIALAVAVLVAIASSASAGAFGNDKSEPQTSKAVSVKKQLKKLTKRIVALEQKKFPDSVPPSGPAKGDLAGSYPNPTIAPNAVGPGKIPDETLTGYEIAPDSLYANDLAPDSVGGSELKGTHVVVSGGMSVPAGQTRFNAVTCSGGEHLLSGGFAWQGTAGRVIDSAPSLTTANRWEVRGTASAADVLYAWALCMQA